MCVARSGPCRIPPSNLRKTRGLCADKRRRGRARRHLPSTPRGSPAAWPGDPAVPCFHAREEHAAGTKPLADVARPSPATRRSGGARRRSRRPNPTAGILRGRPVRFRCARPCDRSLWRDFGSTSIRTTEQPRLDQTAIDDYTVEHGARRRRAPGRTVDRTLEVLPSVDRNGSSPSRGYSRRARAAPRRLSNAVSAIGSRPRSPVP
jgi:hypothetical protein